MDIRQLEMFQAIVETGSFTRAGRKLFVSQSAVSRQIKLLEEELGDQLFKRLHRKIHLTPAGELLLEHARRIFAEMRMLTAGVSDLTELRRGLLRLGGGMSVCTYLFPALFKKYHERFPNVELTIATGTNDELLRLLRADRLEAALLSLPFTDDDLHVTPALVEEMVLVTERNHPLASRRRVCFKDLTPYVFIHFEKGSNTRKLLDGIFEQENVSFHNIMELQNVEITKPLVEIGLGISIIPYPAVLRDRRRRRLASRRITGRRIHRELGWVVMKSDYRSRALKQMMLLFNEMKEQFTPRYEQSGS